MPLDFSIKVPGDSVRVVGWTNGVGETMWYADWKDRDTFIETRDRCPEAGLGRILRYLSEKIEGFPVEIDDEVER